MSFKKKMGMGIAAGALGLSLIGGGTWAAFNDVEETSNFISAGTLDLETSEETLFNLSNMKPGDYITKTLTLHNNGSLAINEILLNAGATGWEDVRHEHLPNNGKNGKMAFLSQFEVAVESEGYNGTFTLADLVRLPDNQRITFEGEEEPAILPGDSKDFTITLTFIEDDETYPGTRLHKQNRFQGEGATIKLKLEATQMPGEERENDPENNES